MDFGISFSDLICSESGNCFGHYGHGCERYLGRTVDQGHLLRGYRGLPKGSNDEKLPIGGRSPESKSVGKWKES